MKSIRKKPILGLSVFILSLCVISWAVDKRLNLSFTEQDLTKHYQRLQTIKEIADASNLPHNQVKFINSSIDSLCNQIAIQVQPQLQDTTKRKK